MSRRETRVDSDLQKWRGIDQRTQPTLLQDGFFTISRGIYFGLGEAERLPGKSLSYQFDGPVFVIAQFDNMAILQGYNEVFMVEVNELANFHVTLIPGVPLAPSISGIDITEMDITTPIVLPANADSFTLQRSLDDVNWTSIATGLAILQLTNDTGLTPATLYYYRVLAVNPDHSTAGPSSSATTLPITSFYRLTETGDFRITENSDDRIIE